MQSSATVYAQTLMQAGILAILAGLLSCDQAWEDSWKPTPIPNGMAWHNEACQQTAFDTNKDGRVDRLRFWRGSGTAREQNDRNLDGWFDELVELVYEKERDRHSIHVRAPENPKTGSPGSFDLQE